MRLRPAIARAAERAGVGRRTVQRWMQRDEEFALAVDEARQDALDTIEHLVYLRATTGTPKRKVVTRTLADGRAETTVTEEMHISDTLAMFYLKRWRPEYRENFGVQRTDGVLHHRDRAPARDNLQQAATGGDAPAAPTLA